MSEGIYPLTIYYDSHCPLCKAEMDNLMLRNEEHKLVFADIWAEGFSLPQGYSAQDLQTRLHARQANGALIHSLAVFQRAYEAVGLGWVTAFLRWPLIGPFMNWFYPIFARHRHRIPRWISQGIFHYAARRALKKRCTPDGSCRMALPQSQDPS